MVVYVYSNMEVWFRTNILIYQTHLKDSIGECGEEKYTTNRANLGANYSIRIVSLVLAMTFVILFFELTPERGVWSIPIKPEEEHMLAAPGSGGYPVLLMQKQG
jgi:hypothetical protein